MVSKRYQPLEDARAKAFEEARLQREARQSRSGGKYQELKAEHSRAAPEQKSPDRAEQRDTQSRGIEDQGPRRTTSIEDMNKKLQNDNFKRNKATYDRGLREYKAELKTNSLRLEYMRQNRPDEYKRQVADEQRRHDRTVEIRDASASYAKKVADERASRPENRWSRELSDEGRQTSDQTRKGREGQERNGHDGHDRTGR